MLARLVALRRHWPADLASAAIELLDLRARARPRFARAESLFLTRAGLEQASGDAPAAWRAARVPEGARILDLCCGIGGDSSALASRGPVFAFDLDPVHAWCAAANASACDALHPVHAACADVTRLRLRGDFAVFDPSRRPAGRRVRDAGDYSPPLAFALEVQRAVPRVVVKASPALPDPALDSLGGRVEFVSHRGECKEAVVWLGEWGPRARRSAAILPAGLVLEGRGTPPPALRPPGEWLLEPDSAVIRAGLVAEAAEVLDAAQMDGRIAYLTSDHPANSPLAASWRILEALPFGVSRIRSRLRALGSRAVAVKRRGAPIEPEELLARLPREGDRSLVVVVTRVAGRLSALLCEAGP